MRSRSTRRTPSEAYLRGAGMGPAVLVDTDDPHPVEPRRPGGQ
ncbi:MAG: hypothetical protein QOE59_1594, partial [Actinomycetota bacterium]|nr:hypothetical protein [Actinomycetota bacterium]